MLGCACSQWVTGGRKQGPCPHEMHLSYRAYSSGTPRSTLRGWVPWFPLPSPRFLTLFEVVSVPAQALPVSAALLTAT